jgi:RNA polymerase sigma factor (sigma-70 family)
MKIEDLYNRYGPMVIRRCRHLLKDEHDALDVAQDVFVRLLQREGGTADITYPSSMLYRIATNLCLNRIRDSKLEPLSIGSRVSTTTRALTTRGPLSVGFSESTTNSLERWLFYTLSME